MKNEPHAQMKNEPLAQMKNDPHAPSTLSLPVLYKHMIFTVSAPYEGAAKANTINKALFNIWQEHLWPSMQHSTTQNMCRTFWLGTLAWKMCTILTKQLVSDSGKRYTCAKNRDRQHGISHRFGLERCNGAIINGIVHVRRV
jgi:hypothetical protein